MKKKRLAVNIEFNYCSIDTSHQNKGATYRN